jgi:regulatory protein
VAALDRAAAEGYLDDREYAEALVRRRSTSRGHALIAQELRSKGIADLLAEPALAQIDPELELARGLRLGRSLLAGRRLADGDSLLNYLAPKLARRGFSGGLVYRICRRLTDDYEAARLFDTKNDHN